MQAATSDNNTTQIDLLQRQTHRNTQDLHRQSNSLQGNYHVLDELLYGDTGRSLIRKLQSLSIRKLRGISIRKLRGFSGLFSQSLCKKSRKHGVSIRL